MSIFDLFKRKKTITDCDSQESVSQKQHENVFDTIKQREIPSTESSQEVIKRIHPDLEGLIWIGDGKYKNYTQKPKKVYEYNVDCITFVYEYNETIEPSVIFTKLPINKPENAESVEKLHYFPCYGSRDTIMPHSELTPEQRWKYLNFLTNPYIADIDIGYVFLLYYGLERHLLDGDFDRAMTVVLKLRKVHKQKSFQTYTGNAIILASILKGKGEYARDFFYSLNQENEYEYIFSHNLYLLGAYSFDIPLTAKDIVRMAQTFEFSNRNYITKYYDIFLKNLDTLLTQKTGKNTVNLKDYITPQEIKKLPIIDASIFVNYSLDVKVPVTRVQDCFKLKRDMNVFLEAAHELTKLELAELRKRGDIKPEPKKPKKNVYFQENYITAAFMKYKINVENINETEGIIDFDKNFRKYVSMYEKARNIEKDDITKAIMFYLKILEKTTPTGSSYWDRPLILLERIKMYNEAYFICQRAAKVSRMPHVRMGDFDLRLARLAKKASDQ